MTNSKKWHTCPETGRKVTQFEHKWGIHAKDLAEQEIITPDAIHMRVRNFGTPFQRKPQPSVCEIMYGKTLYELAREIGIHPTALDQRIRLRGTAYYSSQFQHIQGKKIQGKLDWESTRKAQKPQGWLHENHPWHSMWRVIMIKYVLEGMTVEQAIEKMLSQEAPVYEKP